MTRSDLDQEPGTAPPGRPELERPEIHVWLARSDEIRDEALLAAYRALLTDAERARGERFRFERHRRQFWVTRALVRTTLSHYTGIPPEAFRFEPNEHGRPKVVAPHPLLGLSFNLSHTAGLVACAVASDAVVGCDVEDLERRVEIALVAGRFFTPQEVSDIRSAPPGLELRRFLELWTLKESYLKARGTGLRLPLHGFSYSLRERAPGDPGALPGRIELSFCGIEDDPARWQLCLRLIGTRHVLATALESERPRPLRLIECVPLSERSSS